METMASGLRALIVSETYFLRVRCGICNGRGSVDELALAMGDVSGAAWTCKECDGRGTVFVCVTRTVPYDG